MESLHATDDEAVLFWKMVMMNLKYSEDTLVIYRRPRSTPNYS